VAHRRMKAAVRCLRRIFASRCAVLLVSGVSYVDGLRPGGGEFKRFGAGESAIDEIEATATRGGLRHLPNLDTRPTISSVCPADSDGEAHVAAGADARGGTGVKRDPTFSLSDVVSKGFEATYTAKDGTLYFWHRNFGVKIEKRTGKATLLTDPDGLPETRWVATSLGAKELQAAASKGVRREPGEAV
jgi:hypothetical protein